jgi:hypothetical protein
MKMIRVVIRVCIDFYANIILSVRTETEGTISTRNSEQVQRNISSKSSQGKKL